MKRPFLLCLLVGLSSPHEHESEYIKYPLYDGYVKSCSQKEENFGFEETLEVRRYMPDIRSRSWGSNNHVYQKRDGNGEATTSRVETRAYHTTDERSMGQTFKGEPNVKDAFTATRGTETTTYQVSHQAPLFINWQKHP